MSLQNRVTPLGEIVRDPARGHFMGNRGGRLHDPVTRELGNRRWASKAWICCTTSFKNRHRNVMGMSYTELFFLDEVTALSAGHRPCYECRRPDALAFARAVQRALNLPTPPRAGWIDERLHRERLVGRDKARHSCNWNAIADGTMVEIDGEAYAVRCDRLLAWNFAGYRAGPPPPHTDRATVLTPPTICLALQNGYRPHWQNGSPIDP